MGTNFYIKRKLEKQDKEDIIESIQNDDIKSALEILHSYNDIHIGKRSAGWKFLFNANNFQYFNPNKESFIEFLKSGQIVDEYGDTYTFDEFWDEEIPEGDDLYDAESYHLKNKNALNYYNNYKIRDFIERFDIPVNTYGEFYIDDLRFTVEDEFC